MRPPRDTRPGSKARASIEPGCDLVRYSHAWPMIARKLNGSSSPNLQGRPGTAYGGGDLAEDEEAESLAELRALAGGRADLLAEVAGIFEGTREGELDEPLARLAARLCRMADADAEAIPAWIAEGQRGKLTRAAPRSQLALDDGDRVIPSGGRGAARRGAGSLSGRLNGSRSRRHRHRVSPDSQQAPRLAAGAGS